MKSIKRNSTSTKNSKKNNSNSEKTWEFDLYVAGQTPETINAVSNLKNICKQHLNNDYKINIIDLLKNPQLAKEMQIFAIPTTIKKLPQPVQRFIGDFSNPRGSIKFGIKEGD